MCDICKENGLTEQDIREGIATLNDSEDEVVILGMTYLAGQVLHDTDPIAFGVLMSELAGQEEE